MSFFDSLINTADRMIWGWGLILLILFVGVYLTFKTKFIQVLHLGKALKFMFKDEDGASGDVSSFGALCTSLSATIGTGNIVGVSLAVSAGGPGALFWMLVSAFFGMATKYAEGLLAVKYRVKKNGSYLGGPFYYIEKGMGKSWKWLSNAFAFFGLLAGLLGIGTITQINSITSFLNDFFDGQKNILFCINESEYSYITVISGVIVTVLAAMVIIGGIKRISNFSKIVVPFMAISYVFFTLLIVAFNYKMLPDAVNIIIKSAFDTKAVSGAIVGITFRKILQEGIGRGIFSNEAGLGSAPIASAAARTNQPARQGLVSMTATFIDTIVICTLTGLSVVITGAYDPSVTGAKLEGVGITAYAWQKGLPFSAGTSSFLLMLCLICFAFTTIIGWNYYGERCMEYLTGSNGKSLKIYRWLYIAAVFIGPYLTVSQVWTVAGIFNGLMAFPNLIALISLGGVVAKETDRYFKKL